MPGNAQRDITGEAHRRPTLRCGGNGLGDAQIVGGVRRSALATQRRAQATFLGLPFLGVDTGIICGAHAGTPIRDSSSSRSRFRLRNRWLLMVPSARSVRMAISAMEISSR